MVKKVRVVAVWFISVKFEMRQRGESGNEEITSLYGEHFAFLAMQNIGLEIKINRKLNYQSGTI